MHVLEPKKTGIAIMLGLACFFLSFAPVSVDTAYDLYILPGLVLPAAMALYGGMVYAVICCTLGLAMFSPFLVVPTNGWGNLVTALFILLCMAGQGLCHDWMRKRKIPFFSLYVVQALFTVLYFICNRAMIQWAVRFNPPFWYTSYAFTYLPENLINANSTVMAEVLGIAVLFMDGILSLPWVKRWLRLPITGFERANTMVVLVSCGIAVLSAGVSTNGVVNGMMSISFTVNVYQSSIGNAQMALLKGVGVLLVGNFLMHFLEYRAEQEQKTLEMSETQKAVFESSDDLIWCIDGEMGNILTYNSDAKRFFDEKSGGFCGQNFYDLFSDEDAVRWHDYCDEMKTSDHHVVEYYDASNERYYRIKMHRIFLNNKKYNVAIFAKDITDEIQYEDQEKRIHEELEIKVLERTKELKSAYLEMENMCYVIAHEFKSPIRAINLYNDIMAENIGKQFTEDTRDASHKISMYCHKTLAMISKILQFSKINASKISLVTVNMNKLIDDAIGELRMIYPQRDIRLHVGKMPSIMGDEILLRCCVYNILSNSVKYSSKMEYTEITVAYQDTRDETIFSFRDNGVGFDMTYSKNLFQMFNRMHLDSEFEGNGIGLVTVKNIIKKHGGDVHIKAKMDEGCMVSFSIPK